MSDLTGEVREIAAGVVVVRQPEGDRGKQRLSLQIYHDGRPLLIFEDGAMLIECLKPGNAGDRFRKWIMDELSRYVDAHLKAAKPSAPTEKFTSPKSYLAVERDLNLRWSDDPDWWITLDGDGQFVIDDETAASLIEVLSAFLHRDRRQEH